MHRARALLLALIVVALNMSFDISKGWAGSPGPRITGNSSSLGYINVKDFGAMGNGITNDSAAIQAADTAAAATGGVVYFPPGTYLCTVNKAGANVDWVGASTKAVVLKPLSAASPVITVKATAYGTAIKRMTLDGNTTGQLGLYFEDQGGIRFLLEDLIVTRFASGHGYGISNQAGGHAYSMVWKNVEVTYNKNGVVLTDYFDNFSAFGCRFWYNTEHQVYLTRGSRSRVDGVYFYSCEVENPDAANVIGLSAKGVKPLVFTGYTEAQATGQLVFELEDSVGEIFTYSNGNSDTEYAIQSTTSYFDVGGWYINYSQAPPWNIVSGYVNLSKVVDYSAGTPRWQPTTYVSGAHSGYRLRADVSGHEWTGQLVTGGDGQFLLEQQTAEAFDTQLLVWSENSNDRTYDGQVRVYGRETGGKTQFVLLMHDGTYGILDAYTGALSLRGGNTERMRLPGTAPSSGEAAVLIQVNDGAVTSLRQVTVGDAGSCGTGYRCLRVPN